jgi:hypothetical protein
MKLVLDYIYGGAMYLCGAHMQYVIQVGGKRAFISDLLFFVKYRYILIVDLD